MLHILLSIPVCTNHPFLFQSLQIWLKSESNKGEIEVYLCPEDDGGGSSDEGKGDSLSTDMESMVTPKKEKPTQCKAEPDENSGLKYAFISEEDDLGPMGSKNYLMQTEDQTNSHHHHHSHYVNSKLKNGSVEADHHTATTSTIATTITSSPIGSDSSVTDLPFIHLEPPLSEDDYNFALEDSEGIADLFFDDMLQV